MVDAETLFELLHYEMVLQMYNPKVENAEVSFYVKKYRCFSLYLT